MITLIFAIAVGGGSFAAAYFSGVKLLWGALQEQQSRILTVGRYFDSVSELLTGIPSPPSVDDNLMSQLIGQIERKVQDLSVCMALPNELQTSILNNIDRVEWIRKEYDKRARIINAKKTSTSKDRFALRVELVKAAFIKLRESLVISRRFMLMKKLHRL